MITQRRGTKTTETETRRDLAYWIHRLKEEDIGSIHKKSILTGSTGARTIKRIKKDDKILFCMPFGIKQRAVLSFVGYGIARDVFDKDRNEKRKKRNIRLGEIRYFKETIPLKEVINELKFIKRKDNASSYLTSAYREISVEEFKAVAKGRKTTSNYPDHLEKMVYTTEELLIDSVNGLFDLLKETMKYSDLIEIKSFIKYLHRLVSSYGLSKSYEELERFYSENAWKFEFEHVKSREPKLFVALYDQLGNPNNFGYIRLR